MSEILDRGMPVITFNPSSNSGAKRLPAITRPAMLFRGNQAPKPVPTAMPTATEIDISTNITELRIGLNLTWTKTSCRAGFDHMQLKPSVCPSKVVLYSWTIWLCHSGVYRCQTKPPSFYLSHFVNIDEQAGAPACNITIHSPMTPKLGIDIDESQAYGNSITM